MTPLPNRLFDARPYVKLSRPQNVLLSGMLAIISARHVGATWQQAGSCYLVLLCLYALAAGYNNLRDTTIDTINKRSDNPLVQRQLSPQAVRKYFVVIIAVLCSLQLLIEQPYGTILCALYILLLIGYSQKRFNMQARGELAHIILAICYGVIPIMLGLTQGGNLPTSRYYLVLLIVVVLLLPALLAKDYKDIRGDRICGKRTPLVRHGKRYVSIEAGILTVTGVVLLAVAMQGLAQKLTATSLGMLYGMFIMYVHYTSGVIPAHFNRAPQLLLLGIFVVLL